MQRIIVARQRTNSARGGIVVSRPTPLGNPFELDEYSREERITRYRTWFAQAVERGYDEVRANGQVGPTPRLVAQLERILAAARAGDITLLCHCAPKACHADVIAEYVRRRLGLECMETLTPAQRLVFDYVVRGWQTKAIADKLELSHFTVTNHLRLVLSAFGCANRLELLAMFAVPPPRAGSI